MADNAPNPDPILRDAHNYSDKAGKQFLRTTDKVYQKTETHAPHSHQQSHGQKDKPPAGGFDPTSVPSAPPGYTIRITFHRASNLPFADLNSLSSDPYLIAVLRTDLPKRHKQDPDLTFRTPTIRRNTDPEWNSTWEIAHIPASGFAMKIRLYDEDPADHDDRLGNVHVKVGSVSENFTGLIEQSYDIEKRSGSKRAYLFRGCAALVSREVKMDGQLVLSVECLGRSEGGGGRAYTIGPLPWTRHYSPLIGRLTGTKDVNKTEGGEKQPEQYNFQAIQMQLPGPVPAALYHRYVEFKPFVAGMFTSHSLRGRILNRALHHQHNRIYNFDRSTLYGFFKEPCVDMTKQFLDFVQYDHGGRIFTYVLTLDAQWRFTETGKEFGIDLLSKHTMHSDVSSYIAFSGEFFIRRLKKPWRPKIRHGAAADTATSQQDDSNGPDPQNSVLFPGPESDAEDDDEQPQPSSDDSSSSQDPSSYELIIDNDSGTYRPNAQYLPTLRQYMRQSLPGLRVVTLDCQSNEEKMSKLKNEQRERKQNMKDRVQYLQRSSTGSSISSSDEEDLDELTRRNEAEGGDGNKKGKRGKAGKVKHEVEVAKGGLKGLKGSGGLRKGQWGRKRKEGEEHDGEEEKIGGIVGEDGPVKRREGRERGKAEKGESGQEKGVQEPGIQAPVVGADESAARAGDTNNTNTSTTIGEGDSKQGELVSEKEGVIPNGSAA